MTDRGFAAQLVQDLEPDDVRMVLSVFSKDLERLTGMISAALAAGDTGAFRRAAHGLAGAAGAVGAAELERVCRKAMNDTAADATIIATHEATIRQMTATALAELAEFVQRLDKVA